MNKTQLVEAVAAEANLSKKDAEAAVKATFAAIEGALVKGDKVQLIGFGTFETRVRGERTGKNPRSLLARLPPSRQVRLLRISSTSNRIRKRTHTGFSARVRFLLGFQK